tara:strand:+ start:273 stop:1133 length:861 start_codon:yes stop_codon:yes gene_type:complete
VKPSRIVRETIDIEVLDKHQGHKYEHGHALVVSGASGRTGASRLAAKAALRIGAGAVTLAVPPTAQLEVSMHITALMQQRVSDADTLRGILSDDRISSVCIGPGLGVDAPHPELVQAVLESGKQCVLDADALTILAQNEPLKKLLGPHCVLTPHAGEFQRLFGRGNHAAHAMSESDDKAHICLASARKAGAIVLYKGAITAIAHPDGRMAMHHALRERAAPWLATAGAGDVLAGMIAGLIARSIEPFTAAQYATWLHVEAARSFGPGLIAEDLTEELPKVFRELGL